MATVPETKATASTESLEERFQRLAAIWYAETAHHSSPTIREKHWAYQEIMQLGAAAIPFLLRDLEGPQPNHWYGALQTLTGANPIQPEHAGRIVLMAQDWLKWGREYGYRW